jgi:predicted SAM-dependent methyltransferase
MKLHLGCGKRYIPGFIHVDLADYPHIDYKSNVSDLSMFADETVEVIYSSHTLEYFDRQEAQEKVLPEWHRVLKGGGILRVAVPDIEALIKVYAQYKDLDKILGPLYGRMTINTPEGERRIYHRTVYDFKSLKELLISVGFKNIRRYEFPCGQHNICLQLG